MFFSTEILVGKMLFADKNEVSLEVSYLYKKHVDCPNINILTSTIESLDWMFLRSFCKEPFQVFKPQTIGPNLVITGTDRSILSCYQATNY